MQARIQKILKFEGLIAATFTSYKTDGSLGTDVAKYVDHLCNNGVGGIFLNGTTGESLSLSVQERKVTLEKWTEAAKGRLLIIVQIGANCILEAKDLATHAESLGVDAIATIPPTYYRPNDDDELVRYLEEISSAAPATPLVYYHIPKVTGVCLNLSTFLPRAKKRVPSLCGAKYTSTDLADLVRCQLDLDSRFKIMLGAEELILAVLPYGINTFIGISFSSFAPLVSEIISESKKGNSSAALQLQNKLTRTLDGILTYGPLVPALKATMNILTNSVDVGEPRPPLFPLDKDKREALASQLKALGY